MIDIIAEKEQMDDYFKLQVEKINRDKDLILEERHRLSVLMKHYDTELDIFFRLKEIVTELFQESNLNTKRLNTLQEFLKSETVLEKIEEERGALQFHLEINNNDDQKD